MSDTYDVVVIGSGPGGYVAAIRCAQLGLKTACVERENLGGICLNWGCIPTKALLRSAELLETMHRAKEFGILAGDIRPDFPAMIQRSRAIADKVSKGVGFLFRKNKIAHLAGTATLLPRTGAWKPHRIQVEATGGRSVIETKHVILATGARARSLPGITIDGERIIEYRKAMTLPDDPVRGEAIARPPRSRLVGKRFAPGSASAYVSRQNPSRAAARPNDASGAPA